MLRCFRATQTIYFTILQGTSSPNINLQVCRKKIIVKKNSSAKTNKLPQGLRATTFPRAVNEHCLLSRQIRDSLLAWSLELSRSLKTAQECHAFISQADIPTCKYTKSLPKKEQDFTNSSVISLHPCKAAGLTFFRILIHNCCPIILLPFKSPQHYGCFQPVFCRAANSMNDFEEIFKSNLKNQDHEHIGQGLLLKSNPFQKNSVFMLGAPCSG